VNRESKFGLILFCALVAIAAPGLVAAQAAQVARAAEPAAGRLFFTPAQRASLDVARTQRARATLSNEKTEQEAAPVPQTITYGGVVRRSDGKSTAWFNNQPVNDREPLGGAAIVGRVRPDGSVTLQVLQSGRSVSLRPGQSVELLSGAVEEGYSRKPVQLEPKSAAKPVSEARPAAKPLSPDRAAEERGREEREQQRVEDAVSRALQGTTGARLGTAAVQAPEGPAR
jgi:hypothetical protein